MAGGGAGGAMAPPLLLRPVGKLSMLSEIVKVVDGGGGGGEGRFKMLSSGKFFGLSEKIFGLPEKYCPWPPLKHWSHGATGIIIYAKTIGRLRLGDFKLI